MEHDWSLGTTSNTKEFMKKATLITLLACIYACGSDNTGITTGTYNMTIVVTEDTFPERDSVGTEFTGQWLVGSGLDEPGYDTDLAIMDGEYFVWEFIIPPRGPITFPCAPRITVAIGLRRDTKRTILGWGTEETSFADVLDFCPSHSVFKQTVDITGELE